MFSSPCRSRATPKTPAEPPPLGAGGRVRMSSGAPSWVIAAVRTACPLLGNRSSSARRPGIKLPRRPPRRFHLDPARELGSDRAPGCSGVRSRLAGAAGIARGRPLARGARGPAGDFARRGRRAASVGPGQAPLRGARGRPGAYLVRSPEPPRSGPSRGSAGPIGWRPGSIPMPLSFASSLGQNSGKSE